MKIKFYLAATSFLMIFSESSFAGWWEGNILSVQNNSPDHVIIKWSRQAPYNCQGANQIILKKDYLGNSDAMFERSYIGILQATATQKPIRFQLDGCDGNSMKALSVQICATDPCVP